MTIDNLAEWQQDLDSGAIEPLARAGRGAFLEYALDLCERGLLDVPKMVTVPRAIGPRLFMRLYQKHGCSLAMLGHIAFKQRAAPQR